jgi:hypothetical protein
MALAGFLAPPDTAPADDVDRAAILAMLDAEVQGRISVSDAIVEEHRDGP